MSGTIEIEAMSNELLSREIERIGALWEGSILKGRHDEGQRVYGPRFSALLAEQTRRKAASAPQVVRLRFLAGESSRDLDRACAEALGWRVSRDAWWNWHPGPVYDPPGDEWCIRKDGRNDVPCNEALPHFTSEMFERLSAPQPPKETNNE